MTNRADGTRLVAHARFMAVALVVAALVGVIGESRAELSSAQRPSATALLTAARRAIGTTARLEGLKALALYGSTRRGFNGVTGDLMPPGPVEVRILLPDNYLRIETFQGTERRSGFAGDVLLHQLRLPPSRTGGMSKPSPDLLPIERARFARLALGMLCETRTSLLLDAQQPAPGSPDTTLRIVGTDGFSAFLDLDETTRIPLRVRYEATMAFPRKLSEEERKRGVPPPPKGERTEVVLTFDDRRLVDGLLLPHHVLLTARDVIFEEMQFDTIVVNPPLTPEDFVR